MNFSKISSINRTHVRLVNLSNYLLFVLTLCFAHVALKIYLPNEEVLYFPLGPYLPPTDGQNWYILYDQKISVCVHITMPNWAIFTRAFREECREIERRDTASSSSGPLAARRSPVDMSGVISVVYLESRSPCSVRFRDPM